MPLTRKVTFRGKLQKEEKPAVEKRFGCFGKVFLNVSGMLRLCISKPSKTCLEAEGFGFGDSAVQPSTLFQPPFASRQETSFYQC